MSDNLKHHKTRAAACSKPWIRAAAFAVCACMAMNLAAVEFDARGEPIIPDEFSVESLIHSAWQVPIAGKAPRAGATQTALDVPLPIDFPQFDQIIGLGDGVRPTEVRAVNREDSCFDWQWRNPLPFGHNLRVSAPWQGGIVLAGEFGLILHSTNLKDWDRLDPGFTWPINTLASGSGGLLVVGAGGQVVHSEDGEDWTEISNLPGATYFRAAYGNGVYVLAGIERIATSTDGVVWTEASFPGLTIGRLVFGDDHFVAAANDGQLLRSADGVDWELLPTPVPTTSFPLLTHGEAGWMIADATSVFLSDDLATWVPVQHPIGQPFSPREAKTLGGRYSLLYSVGIFLSEDGLSWTNANWPGGENLATAFFHENQLGVAGDSGVIQVDKGERWLDVGSSRQRQRPSTVGLFHVVESEGQFLAAMIQDQIAISSDGEIWDFANFDPTGASWVWGVSKISDTWYALGSNFSPTMFGGRVWRSSDGLSWELDHSFPGSRWPRRMIDNGSRIVLAGNNGFLRYSEDGGDTWSERLEVTDNTISDLIWANGLFVGVTGGGEVISSPDGIDWTVQSLEEGNFFSRALWINDQYVILGENGVMLTSSDANAWNQADLPVDVSLTDLVYWNDKFYLAGFGGIVLNSNDFIAWSVEQLPTSNLVRRLLPKEDDLLAIGQYGSVLRKACGDSPDSIVAGRVVPNSAGEELFFNFTTTGQLNRMGGGVFPFTTDASGYFAVNGLPAGTYSLRINGFGEYPGEVFTSEWPCPGNCSNWQGEPIVLDPNDGRGGLNFALSRGGRISGRVVDAATGTPDYRTVPVFFFEQRGWSPPLFSVAGGNELSLSGTYLSNPLPPGVYFVQSGTVNTDSGRAYQRQLFDGLPCPLFGCVRDEGTPVVVEAGSVTSDIDFELPVGGIISGTVTDGETGMALPNVTVEVFDTSGSVAGGATTDADGFYRLFNALPPGDYRVRTGFGWVGQLTNGYIDQLYPGIPCPGRSCDFEEGAVVTVPNSLEPVTGIDFELVTGSTISGQVFDLDTNEPLPGATVLIYDQFGQPLTWVVTDGEGRFQAGGFPAGTYFARTSNNGELPFDGVIAGFSDESRIDQLYDGIPCPSGFCDVTSGTPIEVGSGRNTVGNIDFSLPLGAALSGRVVDGLTGAGLPNRRVRIFDAAGIYLGSMGTDPNGNFRSPGLEAGNYLISVDGFGPYLSTIFPRILCVVGLCDPLVGQVIELQLDSEVEGLILELWVDRIFRNTFD